MKDFKAIVFTSNTGHTEQYARMLSEVLKVPFFSLKQAIKHLSQGDSVFYMGWILGSKISGLSKARRFFSIRALASVGLLVNDDAVSDIKRLNSISDELPFFALPGGLSIDKLHGIYRLMFKMGQKALSRSSSSPDEDKMQSYKIFTEGADFVSETNLKPIIAWCNKKA